ncbi:MAG: HK97 gp10 family phage protein [Magnetococcales bacterium]|nr:HK97 gp10 family phage protein [Magnetococcales bacterium]
MKIAVEHNIQGVDTALKQAPDLLMLHVTQFLKRGASEVTREAKREAPKAFTTLAQAIHYRRVGAKNSGEFIVYAGTSYAAYVEEGRKPGGKPPPRWMIEAWINVGSGIKPQNPDMDSRDLAYVISRSIAKKGTKPRPFMAPALDKKTDRLTQLVRQGIIEGLQAVTNLGAVKR